MDSRCRSGKAAGNSMKADILYITFDGLLDPISYSQSVPYLERFARDGYSVYVLSYEKKKAWEGQKIDQLREHLKTKNIYWYFFKWHNRPYVLAQVFNLTQGLALTLYLAWRKGIRMGHARSYLAGLLVLALKWLTRAKFLFDMRGFWADEKVDAGSWKKGGILYRLVKRIEKILVFQADRIVVLTHQARELLPALVESSREKLPVIDVIPCCVDVERFATVSNEAREKKRAMGFPEDAFVMAYLGSVGTFYMFEEMVSFFKVWKNYQKEALLLVITPGDKTLVRDILRKKEVGGTDYRLVSCTPEEVPCYLSVAQVGLCFLTMTFSKQASSAIKFAEYLAAGLPVIVNQGAGDLPEIVERERVGSIISQYCEDEYLRVVREMKQLLDKGEAKARCQDVARKYFSYQIGHEKYGKVYRELLPL